VLLHPALRGHSGKERIDLASDPPPDLAIVIDATSATRPEDYEPLRVPELWVYREDTLYIYVFDGNHYHESAESSTFPGMPLRRWNPEYLQRAWQAGSSLALQEFENALRELSR
jgi:hypothetical protein